MECSHAVRCSQGIQSGLQDNLMIALTQSSLTRSTGWKRLMVWMKSMRTVIQTKHLRTYNYSKLLKLWNISLSMSFLRKRDTPGWAVATRRTSIRGKIATTTTCCTNRIRLIDSQHAFNKFLRYWARFLESFLQHDTKILFKAWSMKHEVPELPSWSPHFRWHNIF